jgi:polysaccharide export outer membrane protein
MTMVKGPSRRTALYSIGATALAMFAAGCVSGGGPEQDPLAGGDVPLSPLPTLADYRLGTGDELRVNVFGEPDLTGVYVVGSGGTIAFPLVGEVDATSLSVAEFGVELQAKLAGFIRQPIVSVEVTNYRPFFILGEVAQPGTYPYSARLTVPNAVATAGGFTYRANTRRVFIKHANEESERAYELTTTTPVLPGDTVRIVERRF